MFESRRLSFTEIPLVDIGPLISGADNERRRETESAIFDACEHVGFFYIKNHGIPDSLRDRMLTLAEEFFALPLDAKNALHMSKSPSFRGFMPFGSKGIDPTKKAKGQEGFTIQRELGPDDDDVKAKKPLHAPNMWPQELPEMRSVMLEYFAAMESLSNKLLASFARGLGLADDYFVQYHKKSLSMLRLLHYPRHKATDESEIGTRAHRDSGELTILLQDSTGGLEVQNKAGEWVQAVPVDGAYIVNIGRSMETWTNGRFVATPHRVVNRNGDNRYSVPFFTNPDFDTIVKPVPSTGKYGSYEPMHAGENALAQYRKSWPSQAA
jgi:isopenicillin N synthase-like dioxygenase